MNNEICNILRDITAQLQNINYNLSQLNQNQQQCNNINQNICDNNQMFIAAQLSLINNNTEISDIQLQHMNGGLSDVNKKHNE